MYVMTLEFDGATKFFSYRIMLENMINFELSIYLIKLIMLKN